MAKMNLVIWLTLSLAIGSDADSHCSPPEDIDALAMAKEGAFSTSSLPGVTEEMVEAQITQELANNPALREIAESVNEEQAANADISQDVVASTGSDAADAQVKLVLQSYYHTCPYRWWWMIRYRWYFLSETANGVEYFWPYYHWWWVSCGQRYCNNSFRFPWYWFHHHRCFPEYRRIWFWVMCLRIQSDGTRVWSSKLIWRYIPRGCCCRRYWAAIATLQCPAAG